MRSLTAFALAVLLTCCLTASESVAGAARDESGTIDAGGATRTYLIHVPAAYDGRHAVPLVLVFHGGGGQPPGMVRISGMNAVADRHGFIAVYPAGLNRRWNDGRTSALSTADDVAFIDALIHKLETQYRIDTTRIYATGISNGAFFSFRLACDLGDEIAAIAPVAGSIGVNFHDACKNQPVSVMMINGTADPLVPYNGGRVGGPFVGQGDSIPVPQALLVWVGTDGCSQTPRISTVPHVDPKNDTTSTTIQAFAGCRNRTSVQLYTVTGGGHTWPGGPQYLPPFIIGVTADDFNASEAMWQFFAAHPRQ
jgi:polyhydroxybutyrate depolymerase